MRLSSHTAQVNYDSKCLQFTNLKWAILYVYTKYTQLKKNFLKTVFN